MINPLEVEQKYQDLIFFLSFPATAYHRLSLIAAFVDFLGGFASLYESYLLQIAERLPQIAHGLPSGGIDPAALESIRSKLNSIETATPIVHEVGGYDRALRTVSERTIEAALYARDIPLALRLLGEESEGSHLFPHEWGPTADEMRRTLRAVAQSAQGSHQRLSAGLHRALESWEGLLSPPRNSVYVPVVEKHLIGKGDEGRFGTLRCATVVYSGHAQKDVLQTDVAVFGADEVPSDLSTLPVLAAETLFKKNFPRRKQTGLACHLHFAPRSGLHEGSSANLAVAALFYSSILRNENFRLQPRIWPTVAVSGGISDDGSVLPIDDDGLRAKTELVFFSHVESFVVPEGQLQIVEEAITVLRKRFPGRHLTIIPVSTLQQIFEAPGAVEMVPLTLIAHASQVLWRNRMMVVGLGLIGLLLLLLGRALYGPLDRNPVAAEWRGESLLLKNTDGAIVHSISVGTPTVRWIADTDLDFSRTKPSCLFDLNGDGQNEIVYMKKSDATVGSSDSIICTAIGRDRPFWSVSSRREFSFPTRTDMESSVMAFSDLEVGRTNYGTRVTVFALANSRPSFPGAILAWDALTGQEVGCYLNIGHLNDIVLADLDNDGQEEVLACGSNNAYHAAALVILDDDRLDGHSPTNANYLPQGMKRAIEQFYSIIPRSVVGELLSEVTSTNPGMYLEVMPDERQFALTVSDAIVTFARADKSERATIKFTFSYDLVLKGVGPEEPYERSALRLFKEGKLSALPDAGYFKRYSESIQSWSGDRFVSITSLNRNGLCRARKPK